MRCARVLAPLSSPNFLDAALRSRRVGIVGTVLSHSAEEVPKKALEQVAQLRPKTVWREGGNSEHLASFFLVCFSLFWWFYFGNEEWTSHFRKCLGVFMLHDSTKRPRIAIFAILKGLGWILDPLRLNIIGWMLVEIFSLSVNISKMPGQRSSWIPSMRWVSKNGENPTFGPCFFGTKKNGSKPMFFLGDDANGDGFCENGGLVGDFLLNIYIACWKRKNSARFLFPFHEQ